MENNTHAELVEALRWYIEETGFRTVAEYEARRGEKFYRPGTRNHQEHVAMPTAMNDEKVGLRCEVRDDGGSLQITDENATIAAQLITGRTITSFEREPDSGIDWEQGENSVTLTLDDGTRLLFRGWGYDASGLTTHYTLPDD